MMLLLLFVWVPVSGLTFAGESAIQPQAVYGEDHRRDLFETADPAWIERARSVGAFFERKELQDDGARGFRLRLERDGSADDLCSDQKFYDQPRGAFCTGFLIGPRTVLTAGHCISKQKVCNESALVFGFAYGTPGAEVGRAAREDVYACRKLIAGGKQSDLDFALIELDRDVTGRAPLLAQEHPDYGAGHPLTMIGHSEGLPAKLADQAVIRSHSRKSPMSDDDTFESDLTSFTGNSGSPVFDALSGRVLGILVAGENDYVRRGKCYVTKRCTLTGCAGEDVVKLDRLDRYMR